MVPKITTGGCSFKGAFAYYLHDKGADTAERIAWTHTENLRTRDPAQAWKAMAYTAKAQERLKEASGQARTGRKLEKPVFAFSLAWHPEQAPSQDHMLETARQAIAALGLSEHETIIVSHRDEPQKHVHVIVNRVHPLTGLAGDVRNSKRKLSDFARDYERGSGKIYCQQREANYARRQRGETTHYRDPHIAQAWDATTTGVAFMAALQNRGYALAQGQKRIVVIDVNGKAHNPARVLGVKAKDIAARLDDIDVSRLPKAHDVQAARAPDDQIKKQRAVFERIVETRTNALRKKQEQECRELAEQQVQRIAHAKTHLMEFYGLKKGKAGLATLREKIRHASWLRKLFGLTRKDREAFRAQARTYHKAVGRFRERVEQIAGENGASLAAMKAKHASQSHELDALFAMQREALYGPAKTHAPVNERAQGRLSRIFAAAQGDPAQNNSEKTRDVRLPNRSNSYRGL